MILMGRKLNNLHKEFERKVILTKETLD